MITIHLTAYDPFGRLTVKTLEGDTMGAENEVLLLPPEMVTEIGIEGSQLLYNPGTEETPLIIRAAGHTEDIIISNKATGQECVIHPLPEGTTIEINGETGRVELIGETRALAFELHDKGYISLAPCTPYLEDATISCTRGSTTIGSDGIFTKEMVGQYVYLNEEWWRLTEWISENEMSIHAPADITKSEKTQIVTMNEIAVSGIPHQLTFDYEPRVR